MSVKKHTVHSFQVYFKPIALRLQLNQFFMNIYPSRLHLKPVQISRDFKGEKKTNHQPKRKREIYQVTSNTSGKRNRVFNCFVRSIIEGRHLLEALTARRSVTPLGPA